MAHGTPNVISHWHQLVEGFSTSTQDFYAAIEAGIRRREVPLATTSRVLWKEGGIASAEREYLRVERRRIAFDICSAPYGTSHFFSWWLARVPPRYGIFVTLGVLLGSFLLLGVLYAPLLSLLRNSCLGAIFGIAFPVIGLPLLLLLLGYLVHEGLVGDEEWVLSLPILGWLYALAFNPNTYYRLDSALMFQDAVRAAVEEVINGALSEKGLRALSAEEFRPTMRELGR